MIHLKKYLVLLLCIFLVGCSEDTKEIEENTAEPEQNVETEEGYAVTLVTPEVFQEKFNEMSSKTIQDDTFLINDISIEQGEENDSFQVNFDESTFLVGILDEEQDITNMMVSVVEDGTSETSAKLMEVVIGALSPTLTEVEVDSVLEELGYLTSFEALTEEIGTFPEEKFEGVQYSMNYSMTDEGYVLCILNIDKSWDTFIE